MFIFANEKEFNVDYDTLLDALAQAVQIAKDYKTWDEGRTWLYLSSIESGREDYQDFEYDVNFGDQTTADAIEGLETMLEYLQSKTKANWDNRLLYNVWVIQESYEEHGGTAYYYVDARPTLTDVDVDGNHTYWFTSEEANFDNGQQFFGFTLDTQNKVTAVTFYYAVPGR